MAGRYTLKQAIDTLCDNVDIENPVFAMRLLVANIQTGSIPVFEPGNSIQIKKPKIVGENYEEVEWADLNRFINGLKVLSSWRFPSGQVKAITLPAVKFSQLAKLNSKSNLKVSLL